MQPRQAVCVLHCMDMLLSNSLKCRAAEALAASGLIELEKAVIAELLAGAIPLKLHACTNEAIKVMQQVGHQSCLGRSCLYAVMYWQL